MVHGFAADPTKYGLVCGNQMYQYDVDYCHKVFLGQIEGVAMRDHNHRTISPMLQHTSMNTKSPVWLGGDIM